MLPLRSIPRLRVTALGIACIALGMLIWAKLMLVTRHPRTAVADPGTPAHLDRPGTAIAGADQP